jgi:hypothetical protein
MTTDIDPNDPIARVQDTPLMLAALRRGAQAALRQHKLLGYPIAVWEDGKVVWIPPEEIELDEEPAGQNGSDSAR